MANLIPHLPRSWGGGEALLVLCGVRHLQHSTPPPTVRVRPGHIQGNAGLNSLCSQQGWGLANSATQRVFQKPWGTATQAAGSVGTILRRTQAWKLQVRHTNLGHGHTHPNTWIRTEQLPTVGTRSTSSKHSAILDRARPMTPKGNPGGGQVPNIDAVTYGHAHHRLFSS